VLGTSEHCIATHASDLAVALTALRAFVLVRGPRGERRIDMDALHRLPGDRPDQETTLLPDELIEAVEIPIDVAARNSVYLKVRDRASFEWALVSAAVGLEIENGRIREARIAMGGVGTKPWRMPVVEQTLVGHAPDRKDIAAAVRRCTEGGRGWGRNDFKLDLMPRVLARAIELAGDAA
jgi:xanthine dehydrogenase YagS FAD-binding subunit